MEKEITDSHYWSGRWDRSNLPTTVDVKKNPITLLTALFDKYSSDKKSMIEIGCAPGIWMHYFKIKHNMNVAGIEYSEVGVAKTKENLRLLGVNDYELIYDDFLNYNFSKKYDLVLSLGFIEHFPDVENIIKKHLKILNENGILIITVPNFDKQHKSLNYRLQRAINKDDLLEHNLSITNLEAVKNVCQKLDLKTKYIDYCGGINLGVTFFGNKHTRLKYFFNLFSSIISRFAKIIKYNGKNRFLSPYVAVVIQS
ncbi:class I SAM-dependent methyltransferase [Patescibacteria group bacterium]